MQHPATPYFDPTWRDDIFDVQAINLPLTLPTVTPRNDRTWVDARAVSHETIFGHRHVYEPYRLVTSVLKPSDMAQYYTVSDEHGNVLATDNPAIAAIFPAKAWMSDSGEERCMMFAAAKQAKGHVLVGGLGLGIYPQCVLALQRPIVSMTIIERNPDIIDLMTSAWLQTHPEHAEHVTIIEGTIEAYLSDTERIFDTVYLDTWEDADPRFLAHVNYLLTLASRHCAVGGTMQCWGYANMVETFTKDMKALTQEAFPWQNYHLDPVLQAYVNLLEHQEHETVSEAAMTQAARTCALTTQQSIETYERHRCFTAFGTSSADAHRNMALSRKRKS